MPRVDAFYGGGAMEFIKIECRDQVTTITLKRPEVMNAIHPRMHFELEAAFDAFAADDAQRICVITGAGEKAFCAGSDLKALKEHKGYPKSGYAGLIKRFDLEKPLIAAVNGLAFGGGFELVLACDIVIAADHATFALPEPLVGAVALGGGLHRLPRQIGLKAAMGMVLTGRKITAQQAFAYGLVNDVVALDELMPTVNAWCKDILRASPMSVRASKATLMQGLDEPSLEAALKNQEDYVSYKAWADSDDAREGPKAFAEKRPPKWQNTI